MMKSLITYGEHIKEHGMGESCSVLWRRETCARILIRKSHFTRASRKRRHKCEDDIQMNATKEECEVTMDSDDSEPGPVTHCCELDDEPLVT